MKGSWKVIMVIVFIAILLLFVMQAYVLQIKERILVNGFKA